MQQFRNFSIIISGLLVTLYENADLTLTLSVFRILNYPTLITQNKLPLRLRKAGRVWCVGAREIDLATRHNTVTPRKTKELLESPCFFRS